MNQSTLDSRTRLILDKTKPVLRFSEVTDGDNHTYKMHFIQGVGTLHHVYLFDPLIPFLQNPLAQQRAYDADEMLQATDGLDWTESVKLAQKNWIGKSVGAEIEFSIFNSQFSIKVFTTRPDTLFGVTFLALAPEHSLVSRILNGELTIDNGQLQEVQKYVRESLKRSEVERQASKEKTVCLASCYSSTKREGITGVAAHALAAVS
jgi:hypothetical protein